MFIFINNLKSEIILDHCNASLNDIHCEVHINKIIFSCLKKNKEKVLSMSVLNFLYCENLANRLTLVLQLFCKCVI